MLKQRVYQNRADRVIAVGRAVLSGFATVAVAVDPPARLAPFVLQVISIYLVLSVVLALWLWRRSAAARPVGTWAIASDIGVFMALVYNTANGSSPFFTMLLFIILSATLKWQWRGALYVGATVLLLFLPTGLSLQYFGPSPSNETMRFVMRVGNLIVLSGLLIYFGAQRERVWEELLRLSKPIEGASAGGDLPVEACLTHVSRFFAVDRVILAWEADEDPGIHAVALNGGRLEPLTIRPNLWPLIDPAVGDTAILYTTDELPARLYGIDGTVRTAETSPLPAAVRAELRLAGGIAVPIHCEMLSGWLIVEGATRDEDLYLARAVAAQAALALDRAASERAWREAAAGEERVRLARDLHDGILQFLSGLSLQLRIVEREAINDPVALKDRLERLQAGLLAEQRELRGFVQGMAGPSREPLGGTADDFRRLARLLAYHWDIEIAADFEDDFDAGPAAADVRQIVREAVANAVRHGAAKRVELVGRERGHGLDLSISDNGSGLGRQGAIGMAQMAAEGLGPRSLRSRVQSLGGDLAANSRSNGLDLMVTLPGLRREAAE